MSSAEEVDQLQQQLAAHRRTLAVYLRQLANLGADYAPPGVHNGIADERAVIAQLKAELHALGIEVDDQLNDMATGDEGVKSHLAASGHQHNQNIGGGSHKDVAVDGDNGSAPIHQAALPTKFDAAPTHAVQHSWYRAPAVWVVLGSVLLLLAVGMVFWTVRPPVAVSEPPLTPTVRQPPRPTSPPSQQPSPSPLPSPPAPPQGMLKTSIAGLQRGEKTFTLILENPTPDQIFYMTVEWLSVSDNLGNAYEFDHLAMIKIGSSSQKTVQPNKQIRIEYILLSPLAANASSAIFALDNVWVQATDSQFRKPLPPISWSVKLP